jgi:hypothetical protein
VRDIIIVIIIRAYYVTAPEAFNVAGHLQYYVYISNIIGDGVERDLFLDARHDA